MTDGATSVVTMNEYAGVLKRSVRLIVAVVVVGAVSGAAMLATQTRQYVTHALVEVRPIVSRHDDPNLDTSRQVNPETEVVIARSLRVAERALALRTAANQLAQDDLRSAEVLAAAALVPANPDQARLALANLQVSIVGDSHILNFEASGPNATVAQALAQSSALAYLQFRRDEATAGYTDSRERLEEREAELVAGLTALGPPASTAGAGDGVNSGATPVLAYAAIAKRQELSMIGTRFANLESLSIDPGVVLTDASVPTSTDGLPLYAGPIMGAMLGLIGALTAVFILDRNDDRLRSSRVELNALGVPLLGTAPVAFRGTAGGGAPLAGSGSATSSLSRVYSVNTPAGDAYRRLQGSLVFNLDRASKSVVLVAGVNNSSAATVVAANVGVTAARAGRRTLIVGADLRQNLLGSHFNLPTGHGLSDVVLDGASLAESIDRKSVV